MGTQSVAIVVRARIGPELEAALPEFDITCLDGGLTRVAGPVPDQAKLVGVLTMFADLHIEIVSVNPVAA